jgi:uncharacterized protein YbjT (DUF2867 family)
MSPVRILVVGASGTLGRPVVDRLLARGVEVRAMSRHPERLADLAARGVEVVRGDLVDDGSLRSACDGTDRVLASAHAILGRGAHRSELVDGEGHRSLVAAAASGGVERFVYVSAFGASAGHPVDFFRTKHAIEEHVRGSGMPHVILRPTAFMEQHVHEFNGRAVLERGKARLIGPGTKVRNFVAASDVARIAVEALLADPAPGPVVEIGGPDHLTNVEIAALYARMAARPLRISRLPAGVARALAAVAGPLHPGVARLLGMMALPDDAYDERFAGSERLERTYGFRMTRVADFVRERVRAAGIAPAA